MVITTGRRLTARADQTSLRLFLQFLHKARELKALRKNPIINKAILVGILWAYHMNTEDFRTADSMRDYQMNLNGGNQI